MWCHIWPSFHLSHSEQIIFTAADPGSVQTLGGFLELMKFGHQNPRNCQEISNVTNHSSREKEADVLHVLEVMPMSEMVPMIISVSHCYFLFLSHRAAKQSVNNKRVFSQLPLSFEYTVSPELMMRRWKEEMFYRSDPTTNTALGKQTNKQTNTNSAGTRISFNKDAILTIWTSDWPDNNALIRQWDIKTSSVA